MVGQDYQLLATLTLTAVAVAEAVEESWAAPEDFCIRLQVTSQLVSAVTPEQILQRVTWSRSVDTKMHLLQERLLLAISQF